MVAQRSSRMRRFCWDIFKTKRDGFWVYAVSLTFSVSKIWIGVYKLDKDHGRLVDFHRRS